MKKFVALGLGLIAGACQSSSPELRATKQDDPQAVQIGRLTAGAETVVGQTIERAHLAFHADGAAFRAGHLTHDAKVSAGDIEFTPRHWDGSRTIDGAPITFATQMLMRGEDELDPQIGASEIKDGSVRLYRASALEQIDNQADGIEQSWRFTSPPSGEGDLTIRVAVSGATEVTTTKSGIHFANPGKLGARYSNAVWRDSNGEAWDVPATWDGHDIVLTVPQTMLDASVFPAVLDPTISAEAAVDTLATGNTGDFARELGVSWSGTNYLVVWRDDRNGVTSDIYGARVAADGSVLDAYGLGIAKATGTQTTPVVAWAGSKWVVAWNNSGDIQAATVTGQGAIAQLGNVAATAAVESLPSIAGQGSTALLVFQSDTDVRAARFSGTTFGAPFDVAITTATEADPTVASNPAGGYLVAWTEGTTAQDIKGQLVTGAGALSGTAFAISAGSGAQTEPASTWNGTNYVVTWTNGSDIFGARVSPTGTVLDTHMEGTVAVGGFTVSGATGTQQTSSVACDSGSCVVLWNDRRNLATTGVDLYGQRVDFNMLLVGTEFVVTTAVRNQLSPSVAGASSGFFGAWEDQRTGGASAAVGTRIDATGAVLDANGIVLNRGYAGERSPAWAQSPSSGALAIWSDSRAFGDDIMAIRYNASGNAIESSAKVVSSSTGVQSDAAVTFDGSHYLAVWRDGRNTTDDIYAARFDQGTGTTMDPAGIAISTAADRQLVPDVASNGTVSLIVWQDRRNGATTGFDIYGALVTQAGTVSLNDIAISTAAGDQVRPAVTFDPADNVFVVVWSDQRVNGNVDIFGTRVDINGNVLDSAGVQISGGANGQFSPDVAVSGSQLLVVWDDRRNETLGDIYGARITAAGSLAVLDANGIAIATPGGQATPTVVGVTGGKWAVAWADDRNSTAGLHDILGNEVSSAGALATEYTISGNPEDETNPAFQNEPNTGLKASVLYQKLRTDINAQRVYRRTLTYQGAQGTSCSNATQCESGFCVDGYCCDQACGGTQNTYPLDCQACSVARGATANGTCSIRPSGSICRGYAGGMSDLQCDVQEFCNGIDTTCPPDLGRNQGQTCTGICGSGVCPANDASGAPHFCDCP